MAVRIIPLSFLEELDNELTCSICMEEFDNSAKKLPKLLPCGHTFCKDCTLQCLNNDFNRTFRCPLCKKRLQLQPGDVRHLPNNLTIISLLDKMRKLAIDMCDTQCEVHGTDVGYPCLTNMCIITIAAKGLHTEQRVANVEAFAVQESEVNAFLLSFSKSTKLGNVTHFSLLFLWPFSPKYDTVSHILGWIKTNVYTFDITTLIHPRVWFTVSYIYEHDWDND